MLKQDDKDALNKLAEVSRKICELSKMESPSPSVLRDMSCELMYLVGYAVGLAHRLNGELEKK